MSSGDKMSDSTSTNEDLDGLPKSKRLPEGLKEAYRQTESMVVALQQGFEERMQLLVGSDSSSLRTDPQLLRDFLQSTEPPRREAALLAVLLDKRKDVEIAQLMADVAVADPDERLRGLSVDILGAVLKRSHDRLVASRLASILNDSHSQTLRVKAYCAILAIGGHAIDYPEQRALEKGAQQLSINWELINTIING
jgi:hypothetical protein